MKHRSNSLPALLALALTLHLAAHGAIVNLPILPTPTGLSPGSTNSETAEAITTSPVSLTWDAVEGADYYEVYLCPQTFTTVWACSTYTVTTNAMLYSLPQADTSLEWRVRAVSASGYSKWSEIMFCYYDQPICNYSVIARATTFYSSGGTGFVSVGSDPGCRWSASSPVSWITIVDGTRRSGSGTVTFTVAPKFNKLSRSTYLNVAGRLIYVTQR